MRPYLKPIFASMFIIVASAGCPQPHVENVESVEDVVLGTITLSVVETSPAADAIDVSSTSAVTATVNKALDPDSVVNPNTNTPTGALVMKNEDGTDVSGAVTYNADTFTLTFTPAQALASGQRYTMTLRDLRAADGGAQGHTVSWSFATRSLAAESELSVMSTNPVSGTTGFPRNAAIVMTFNRELDSTSLVNPMTNTSTGAFVLKTPAGANVAGTITYNPSTASVAFVPAAYLSANLTYIASIGDIRTVDGSALAERYTWTFTTGEAPNALPTIISTTPIDGAADIPRSSNIQVLFSEPVTGIGASTFVVRDMTTNAVLTARSLVFDPVTLTATFRPQANLSPSTLYSITIQDVTGLNGLLLPQHTWSFTTGVLPDTTPVVTSMNPAPGAVGVLRNTRVQVVFDSAVSGISTTTFLLRNSITNTLVTAENVSFTNATRTAQFVPNAFLAANVRYTATLRGVSSVDGVPLAETSWDFTTGDTPDNVVPTITAAGLAARANCATELTLNWSSASDDVTPQAEITYQIFLARSTGGYDLNVPAATTAAGSTSYRVTGLLPGTTYFLTVRAVDASGNRSTGFTERSATTPSTLGCASTIGVAGGPTALARGDFNSDGNLDLAVACGTSNQVAILLGDGSGAFVPAVPATIALGVQPADIKTADMTNDGKLDLIVASRTSGSIIVLPGNGDGSFGASVVTAVIGARGLAVAEVNNPANANRDLAIATGDDITVLSGNGNGTFSGTVLRLTLAGAADVHAVTTGDFDGDGLTDIGVTYAGTDNAAAWLNSTPSAGALAFTTPTAATNRLVTVQNAPSAVAAPDLDGDGRPDLVVVNTATPSVTVRPSSAQAANLFPGGENTALTAGTLPVRIAAGDLDGDGLPDLVTANRGTGTVSVLLNLAGTSLFTVESEDVGLLPSDVVLGDFDADGLLDAAVANLGDSTVSILLNAR
jgi:hypothetical protein